MRRFVQEAKAASALNHPNIITIYEIEQIDSVNFIATEFIDGETLRQRMRNAPLKLGEVLDVAAQIASALSAAHAAGIVHRDIKPENIMLRRDGIVKVLDFGLAKLTEQRVATSVDTEAPTRGLMNTEPGVVMGTAVYMSPEQARGLQVDARTDIFSLGVLIYEMVAGRLPFEGSNTNEILASILSDKEPSPLARYAREQFQLSWSALSPKLCARVAMSGTKRSKICCSILKRSNKNWNSQSSLNSQRHPHRAARRHRHPPNHWKPPQHTTARVPNWQQVIWNPPSGVNIRLSP